MECAPKPVSVPTVHVTELVHHDAHGKEVKRVVTDVKVEKAEKAEGRSVHWTEARKRSQE